MLSSVCSVHGAVVDVEVEEAAVMGEVVVGSGGGGLVIITGVVTAGVVFIKGWWKSPVGPDTVVTAEHRSDSLRLTTGSFLRQSGESQT